MKPVVIKVVNEDHPVSKEENYCTLMDLKE